jgi:hypothetical protein
VARRRTDTPLTILVMGIFTVVMFGGGVVYFSSKTPILQLVPALEEQYAVEGFVTRFHAGGAPYIEVQAPPALVPDDAALLELARFSLERYRELAGSTTRVQACVAKVKGEPQRGQVRVTLELVERLLRARGATREIELTVRRAGLTSPGVEVTGLSRTGAAVRVTARTQRQDAAALVDRAVAAVGSLVYVGRVDAAVQGPTGPITRAGGRDAGAR